MNSLLINGKIDIERTYKTSCAKRTMNNVNDVYPTEMLGYEK